MSEISLEEAFKKIAEDEKIGIPFRTSRLYVQYGLYPRPELRGRKGFYDLEKSQLFEKAELIKYFRDEFKFSISEIKMVLRKREDANYKEWLAQIRRFIKEFPKMEPAKDFQTGEKKLIESDRGLLARVWFGGMMKKEGRVSEADYRGTADSMWKKPTDADIKYMLHGYGIR